MRAMIQQEQHWVPISIVVGSTCKHGGGMITIGEIPQKVNPFQADPECGFGSRLFVLLLAGGGPVHQSRRNDRTVIALVDSVYACLTHVGVRDQRAQGDRNKTKEMLSVPPINQLKVRMHQIIWHQEVQNMTKVSHEKTVIRRLEKILAA